VQANSTSQSQNCTNIFVYLVWLSEDNNKDRPGIDEFFIGRKNKKVYTTFFSRFIPAVVGPELFKRRLEDKDTAPESICTISDEAFALLLIENSYDHWTDIYKKAKGIPKQRKGETTRKFDSDVSPKYTNGGIKYNTNTGQPKSKGWTTKGIERYNELFWFVTTDRKKKSKFMLKFKEHRAAATVKPKRDKRTTMKAVHSLWEDNGIDEPTDAVDGSSDSSSDDNSTSAI
jgi:hypothetical protein